MSDLSDQKQRLINICCAADEAYVMPLATQIKSLLVNLHPDYSIALYLVDGGITETSKGRLAKSWEGGRLALQWITIDPHVFEHLPLWGQMKAIVYYRLMMPTFLPDEVTKVIWLDSDMIVTGDLAELWPISMEDRGALAVQDMVIPYAGEPYGINRYKELGIAPDSKYFNSGLMVVDLRWWREHDVTGKAFAYLRQYERTVYFWDQEGLNAALAGKWGALDPGWNQIANVCGRSFFRPKHLDRDTYQRVIDDPKLIHFAGTFKPWMYSSHQPVHQLYFHYLDLTDWAGWRPPKTLKSVLMEIYDSWLRNFLYPLEKWRIKFLKLRAQWQRPA